MKKLVLIILLVAVSFQLFSQKAQKQADDMLAYFLETTTQLNNSIKITDDAINSRDSLMNLIKVSGLILTKKEDLAISLYRVDSLLRCCILIDLKGISSVLGLINSKDFIYVADNFWNEKILILIIEMKDLFTKKENERKLSLVKIETSLKLYYK